MLALRHAVGVRRRARTAMKVIPGGARPDAERWIDGADNVVPEAVDPPAAAAAGK